MTENINCPYCGSEKAVLSSIDDTIFSAFAFCLYCGDIKLSNEEILMRINTNDRKN